MFLPGFAGLAVNWTRNILQTAFEGGKMGGKTIALIMGVALAHKEELLVTLSVVEYRGHGGVLRHSAQKQELSCNHETFHPSICPSIQCSTKIVWESQICHFWSNRPPNQHVSKLYS